MEKTYGGFQPFEAGTGSEYHNYDSSRMQYYNSGKTAVYYCLMQMKPRRFFVPRYFCPSTKAEIERAGIPVIYYHVNADLSVNLPGRSANDSSEGTCRSKAPDDFGKTPETVDFAEGKVIPGSDDAVLLVNYFGVYRSNISRWLETDTNLIIDHCQAFYEEPVMKNGVLNFYAFKKFFGVPDGAFVIGEHAEDFHLKQKSGLDIADYLIGSMVEGTGPWYSRKKEVDDIIASEKLGASYLTRAMIRGIDYEAVKKKRRLNYSRYLEAFDKINLIRTDTDENAVPYMYPLNIGTDIRKELISRKIFVPTLWADTMDSRFEGTSEYFLSKNTLFLPLDQRYTTKDMDYIIQNVRELTV